jgi:hypothetical protein
LEHPEATFEVVSRAQAVAVLEGCAGAPVGLDLARAAVFADSNLAPGTMVYLSPGAPRPGDLVTLVVGERLPTPVSATARMTANGWASFTDRRLEKWCEASAPSGLRYHGLSLGRFQAGTRLELALHFEGSDTSPYSAWLSNGGANYVVTVRAPERLVWMGDTHLRLGETYLPASMIPTGQDVTVYAQTYPMGAAEHVRVFWANADYSRQDSAELSFDQDGAGASVNNAQWKATIPSSALHDGEPLNYWLQAEDAFGSVLWDSRDGANHSVTPRRYAVQAITGFGSFRPTSQAYSAGNLMSSPDGATAIGCENNGASTSSYVERAVRIWAPGLTDRQFSSEAERRAAVRIIRAEIGTNASADGFRVRPLGFRQQLGGDFVYSYFSFNEVCSPARGLPDGRYEYELRLTASGGEQWFERRNIPLEFGQWCSYFGDAFACHPPSNTYYTFEYADEAGAPSSAVLRFDGPVGNTIARHRVVTNRTDRPVRLERLVLSGSDADLFQLAVVRLSTGRPVPLEREVVLTPGQSLRFELTMNAARPSGPLPHVAQVEWDRADESGAVVRETLLYVRGVVGEEGVTR